MKETVNINLKTGIRYGFISANSLDSDLVHELMYEHGVDYSYMEYKDELEKTLDLDKAEDQIAYDDALESYECEEPSIEGVFEEVRYATSWLGGALNFWIFFSPEIVECSLCSPCVPNAGNLDSQGDYKTYGVPPAWKNKNY